MSNDEREQDSDFRLQGKVGKTILIFETSMYDVE
jgi:hypothetical protein